MAFSSVSFPVSLTFPTGTHTPVPEGPWNLWTPRTHRAVPLRPSCLRPEDRQGLLIYLHPLALDTRTPCWPQTAADLTDTLTSLPAKPCIHLCPTYLALGLLSSPLGLFLSLWVFIPSPSLCPPLSLWISVSPNLRVSVLSISGFLASSLCACPFSVDHPTPTPFHQCPCLRVCVLF